MINNVVLVGRLTKGAELRYTPNQVAVATFTLAVNRRFKEQNGEREADFINCVIWRDPAVKVFLEYAGRFKGELDKHDNFFHAYEPFKLDNINDDFRGVFK